MKIKLLPSLVIGLLFTGLATPKATAAVNILLDDASGSVVATISGSVNTADLGTLVQQHISTVMVADSGFLVAGAVIIESVFRLPGVGQLVYDSINNRDLIVIKNVVILFTILVLVVNLLVDLAYALLDPRPRVAA